MKIHLSRLTSHHDPFITPYQTRIPSSRLTDVEHSALVETLGVVRVLEQNQEQDESTLLAIKTERDNAQVQLVNFRTSMVKNRLAHTTGRYPDHP